jgi:4-carboxymuconolactone decarboxylase
MDAKRTKNMKDDMKNQADDATKAGEGPLRRTIERPTEPRLPLMDVSALPQEQRELADIGASPNVLRVLAHRADLLAPWLGFGMPLTAKGRVPMRIRELLVLRVALRCSCEYEWANHVLAAISSGRTAAEIASLVQGTGSWSDAEAAGLALVDDLCADDCASEETWKALRASYDEGEIIELLLVIGFYRMNAGFLNSLGVPVEPGRPRFGQEISYQTPVLPQRPVGMGEAGALSEGKPDGIWQMKLYHPAVTQEFRLVVKTKEEELSGSLTNEAAGFTVPISEGKGQGHQVTFTTVTTKPYPATVTWDGTIEGDYIAGTATVQGMGSFPFDGTRIAQR